MRRFALLENPGSLDKDIRCSGKQSGTIDLKWVHRALYEMILKQDGAIWLQIISQLLHAHMAHLHHWSNNHALEVRRPAANT